MTLFWMEPNSPRGLKDRSWLTATRPQITAEVSCGKIDFTLLVWERSHTHTHTLQLPWEDQAGVALALHFSKINFHFMKIQLFFFFSGGNILMFPYATMRQSWRLMRRPQLFLLHYIELSVRLVNKCAFPPSRYILQKQSQGALKLFDFTPSWLYYLGIILRLTVCLESLDHMHFSSSLKVDVLEAD